MQHLARDRGGQCLSQKYIGTNSKLIWQCKEGHQWEAVPHNIKRGRWCPACARMKYGTLEEMQRIATQRGGQCLSTEYTNSQTRLTWQCREGHQWRSIPESVKQGSWCPVCRGTQVGSIEEMQRIATNRGGLCLLSEYTNRRTKLTWQCADGHQWQAVPGNIKSGKWCPVCAGGQTGTIKEMRGIARTRGGKCLSRKYINNRAKLTWQCEEGHQWEASASNIKQGTWCPFCAGMNKGTIEEMRKIAMNRGGQCLSEEYINNDFKLTFRCKHGHEWQAAPSGITQGHWCFVCASNAKKGTIEDMQRMADSKGGKCLSTDYISNNSTLTWQCENGHQWEVSPKRVKLGHWCPLCVRKK